jgi:RHS repeat-associated protein
MLSQGDWLARDAQSAGTVADEAYTQDGNNARAWKWKQAGESQCRQEVYFYAPGGERLGTYRLARQGAALVFETVADNLYFNGRLIRSGREVVAVDRLGSVRWRRNLDTGAEQRFDYWPYGQEKPQATAQEREKFGTYYRDATGLDYADQRYYISHWGRFLTADPFVTATALRNPTRGWNRYAYVEGDPVNHGDPRGLCVVRTEEGLSLGSNCVEEIDIGDYSPGAAIQGGGSGTGGTPEGLFIRVRNPSKVGPQQSRIAKVLSWIRDNIDSECAEWLNDVKARIDELLGDGTEEGTFIGHADFDNRYVSAFTGNNRRQTDAPAGFAITVNRQGAFFYGSFWDGRVMRPLTSGGFAGGTSQAQVFILLHELAHSLGAAGFQADFGDEAAGRANDSLVREHCRKTLDAARRMR